MWSCFDSHKAAARSVIWCISPTSARFACFCRDSLRGTETWKYACTSEKTPAFEAMLKLSNESSARVFLWESAWERNVVSSNRRHKSSRNEEKEDVYVSSFSEHKWWKVWHDWGFWVHGREGSCTLKVIVCVHLLQPLEELCQTERHVSDFLCLTRQWCSESYMHGYSRILWGRLGL